MGSLGVLPPLRFGTWGCAKGPSTRREGTRAATGRTTSVASKVHKRKLQELASATGESKRARKSQGRNERILEQEGTCRRLDPRVSEAHHFAEHSGACKGFCFRCDLFRNRKDYEACAMLETKTFKKCWLTIGAHRGVWGMGCSSCAAFASSGAQVGSRRSKFARFQIRPRSRLRAREALLQHATSLSHRRACGMTRVQPLAQLLLWAGANRSSCEAMYHQRENGWMLGRP